MFKGIVFSLLLSTLLLFSPGIVGNALSAWRLVFPTYPRVPYGLRPALFDLKGNRFFIATEHGGFLTEDNGHSWRFIDMKVGSHGGQRIGAFFLDSEKAWAWDRKQVGFSSDGGLNWKIISVSPWSRRQAGDIRKLFFLDEKIGFIFSSWNMARTVDGGRHWSKIPSLPSMGALNSRCWFISPNEGFIIAGNVLYKTDNAGADWKVLFTAEKVIVDAFYYGDNGLVIDEVGDTYTTDDGGGTWHEGEVRDEPVSASYKLNDRGQGLGLESRCLLYTTYDWGRNWATIDLQSVLKKCNSSRITKNILWDGESIDRFAIRWANGIFQTTDGGKTWKQNEIPAQRIWVDGNQKIVGTNTSNQIFYSSNYGKSWISLINEKEVIKDVSINDGRNWSSGGLITTDAGKTWRESPRICTHGGLNFDYHFFGKGMQLSKVNAGLTARCNKDLAQYAIKGLYLFPDKTIVVNNYGIVYDWDDSEGGFRMVGNIMNLKHKNERIKALGPIRFGSKDCGCAFGIKTDKEEVYIENGIFYTSDGGRSWHRSEVEKADNEGLEIPDLSQGKIKEEYKPIIDKMLGMAKRMKGIVQAGFYLEDCEDGWGIVGTYAENWYLIKTTDGGKRWSIVSHLKSIDIHPTGNTLSIAFLDERTGWISDGRNLYKTTDGGANWTRDVLPVKSIEIKKIVIDKGQVFLNASGFVLSNRM